LDKELSYKNLIEFPDLNQELVEDAQEGPTFVSELGQSNLSLYVYNLEEELVFRTGEQEVDLRSQEAQQPEIITSGDVTGYLLIQPVYSK